MTSLAQLVDQWNAQHGGPRRFECGVSLRFEYFSSYLGRFGMRLRMHNYRCHISQNGGRWQPIQRGKVVALVDELRRAEGLQPIKAVRL